LEQVIVHGPCLVLEQGAAIDTQPRGLSIHILLLFTATVIVLIAPSPACSSLYAGWMALNLLRFILSAGHVVTFKGLSCVCYLDERRNAPLRLGVHIIVGAVLIFSYRSCPQLQPRCSLRIANSVMRVVLQLVQDISKTGKRHTR
jgi:hypothetical protein